jgi:cytochrome c
MMKMRTRNPAASTDIGSVIQSETARHRYIAVQAAKNPPNDVASCPRLRQYRRLKRLGCRKYRVHLRHYRTHPGGDELSSARDPLLFRWHLFIGLADIYLGRTVHALAQDGDVAAGRAFAREACNSCHVVEPTNVSPRVVVIGPNFQDIANTKGMTATALRVFLTTSHPKMPNLILTPEQITDVTAYILSLREHQ